MKVIGQIQTAISPPYGNGFECRSRLQDHFGKLFLFVLVRTNSKKIIFEHFSTRDLISWSNLPNGKLLDPQKLSDYWKWWCGDWFSTLPPLNNWNLPDFIKWSFWENDNLSLESTDRPLLRLTESWCKWLKFVEQKL